MARNRLPQHPLFQTKVEFLTPDERVALSYQRARLVLRTHRETPVHAFL